MTERKAPDGPGSPSLEQLFADLRALSWIACPDVVKGKGADELVNEEFVEGPK